MPQTGAFILGPRGAEAAGLIALRSERYRPGPQLGANEERLEPGVSYTPHHKLLEHVAREEHEAQLRLAAARKEAKENEGGPPGEHLELIRKLEAEWKRARERLHLARDRDAKA